MVWVNTRKTEFPLGRKQPFKYEKEVKKLINEGMKDKESLDKIKEQIKSARKETIDVKYVPNIAIQGRKVAEDYRRLIVKAINTKDDPLTRTIIMNRKYLLQDRIVCNITLKIEGEGNGEARINVYKSLIEHTKYIGDYWMGLEIDKSQGAWKYLVELFERQMKKHGAAKVEVTQAPQTNGRVTDVRTTYTFA